MPRSTSTVLLTAALLALAGCGGTVDEPPVGPPPTAAATPEPAAPIADPLASPASEPEAAPEPEAASDDVQVVTLTMAGGEVSGDTGRVEIPLGTDVRLTVTSDTADELHVHGFELTEDLPAGQPVVLEFAADRAGIFEVELHDARRVLTRLQVS